MLHTLSAYAGEGNIDRFYQNSVFEIKNLTQKQWWAGTNQVDLEWEATQTADSYQIVLSSLNGKQTRKLNSKFKKALPGITLAVKEQLRPEDYEHADVIISEALKLYYQQKQS